MEKHVYNVGSGGVDVVGRENGFEVGEKHGQQQGNGCLNAGASDSEADGTMYGREKNWTNTAVLEMQEEQKQVGFMWHTRERVSEEVETCFVRSVENNWKGTKQARESNGTELVTLESEVEQISETQSLSFTWQIVERDAGEGGTKPLRRSVVQLCRTTVENRERGGTELLTFEKESAKPSESEIEGRELVEQGVTCAFAFETQNGNSPVVKLKSSEVTQSDPQWRDVNCNGTIDQEQNIRGCLCPNGVPYEQDRTGLLEEDKVGVSDDANMRISEEEKAGQEATEDIQKVGQNGLKRNSSTGIASVGDASKGNGHGETVVKKAKRKTVNIWAKTSRRGKKKNGRNGSQKTLQSEDRVYLTPVYMNQDKVEDGPGFPILLSRLHKAEKVEVSLDRLSAGSTKGYRMVRATRGVTDGAWYFEITLERLGPTGHTRLGWSTQKGDIQGPVGFDCYSYAYRDVDGSKVHMAVREPYGNSYLEGDVIGFYINLPNGAGLCPKPPPIVCYKGQPWIQETKEEPLKIVPGSEVSFFRNGVCQGVAFKDINAGRYYPAASMYTLPNEPNCTVRFNFGPEFAFSPSDIGGRPPPQPMHFAPVCGLDGRDIQPELWSGNNNEMGNCEPTDCQKVGEALCGDIQ